jgi:hypothetical protein
MRKSTKVEKHAKKFESFLPRTESLLQKNDIALEDARTSTLNKLLKNECPKFLPKESIRKPPVAGALLGL